MQDADLLVQLAGIAGVFVGFGALIAVRSGDSIDVGEVNSIRWVMSIAIWVVIVALMPVIAGRYPVADQDLWIASSIAALVLLGVIIVVYGRAPENRADVAATMATMSRAKIAVSAALAFWAPFLLLVLALALVVLSPLPDQAPALYLTAVGLGLYMAAIGLFGTIFWKTGAQTP
jgi:hypothetical protein